MNTYGYVRVSTREQNEDRQLVALRAFPVVESRVYVDKASGADFERPAYQRMLRRLRKGDVLVVKSIDRLGRNYAEIQEQWRYLTKERSVAMVVLDTPLLDAAPAPFRRWFVHWRTFSSAYTDTILSASCAFHPS